MGTFWTWLNENGFLFDYQQRWTSRNYRAMCHAFKHYAGPNHGILDLGCATSGCVQSIWKGFNPRYIGVDLTMGYLKYAKRKYPATSHARTDIGALPFQSFPFDFVCAFSVLHHLDDGTIQALGRSLSAGLSEQARFLIAEPVFPPMTPNPPVSDRLSRWLLEHDRGEYIREAQTYINLLGNGFQIETSFGFKYGVHHFCGFELRRCF